jgi:hypothetical protein
MRILFTIVHYFRPNQEASHGSERESQAEKRVHYLATCLSALHQTFGRNQARIYPERKILNRTNDLFRSDIEVVICTTGDSHLLADVPARLYRQHATTAEPRLLGYECHEVLRDRLGEFDFYCYLEDDIFVSDPLLFRKLQWFSGIASPGALLQPNRFEVAVGSHADKLYLGTRLSGSEISRRFQDTSDTPLVKASLMGMELRFERVENPHSGCFFLSAEQMAAWAAAPYFLDRSAEFWGPLESAATLGIMRTFKVYKPAHENCGFLEVRHLANRYLGTRLDWPFEDQMLDSGPAPTDSDGGPSDCLAVQWVPPLT